jgi:glycosyltransferase involved in cell wall biosynthesis
LHQTCQDFEIIILDDCSTDNSRSIIESYQSHPKIHDITINKKNSGSPFGLWQKGIDLATGDWIWIAESDDIAEPGFLEEALQAIEQFPSLDTFYCDCFIIDENGKALAEKFSDRKNRVFNTSKWSSSYFSIGINEINECLKFDCTINNMSSTVFRKTLAAAKTAHVDEFHFHGDWFFLLKTVLAGNLYYSNKALNHYRIYEKSHSSGLTLIQSRYECFRILVLLYYNENVKDKKKLLDYFTFNCLAFGLIEDGPKSGWKIFQSYLKTDRNLALKVIGKIANIKLFRKKQTVFAKHTIWETRNEK